MDAAWGLASSRDLPMRWAWGKSHCDDGDCRRVVVRTLRLKIEDDPSWPKIIFNEQGGII